jgi:glycosyltransferase involved in cell wall biosynthesis
MRIAIVTHNVLPGDGQGRVNYELTRFLLTEGHDVTLVARQVSDDLLNEGAHWIEVSPLITDLDLGIVWFFKRAANRIMARIRHRFDVVLGCGVTLDVPHSHNAVHFVHGPWLQSSFHNSKVQSGLQSWYQWLFSTLNARWERHTFAQAEHIIAVSEMVRRELTEIGVPNKKIDVVVNGVDLVEFAPGSSDRASLGLPLNTPLGLFVGDIKSPIKNLDTVLRALVDVPGVHLAVAGRLDGSPYPGLAADLGLSDRVHFLGFRRDIADLMRASDFFTLPSRRDSCPLVLLEALASGLPVIASQNVGNANLLSATGSGVNAGFVVDNPNDVASLSKHLATLAFDDDLRAAMSRAARGVAEKHSWEHMARRYLDLFQPSSTLSTVAA